GISDPGYVLINLALNNNIKIIPIPGVSELITDLVVSGLPTDKFVFEGFLPRKIKERKRYFKSIKNEERTIIFYETPHRLKRALKDMLEILGDRKIVIARELTKKYEEIIRGKLNLVLSEMNTKEIKGEITLVVQGGIKEKGNDTIDFLKDECIMEKYLKKLKNQGYSNKDIIKITQEKLNIPKNLIYKKLLEMKNSEKCKTKSAKLKLKT
ncbi:MAG: SAM-dependent methyltransferase, partial [bacterium]